MSVRGELSVIGSVLSFALKYWGRATQHLNVEAIFGGNSVRSAQPDDFLFLISILLTGDCYHNNLTASASFWIGFIFALQC